MLTIKGVTQPIQTQGQLLIEGSQLHGTAEFTVKPAGSNIKIPGLVRNNITEEIMVKANMLYQPLIQK